MINQTTKLFPRIIIQIFSKGFMLLKHSQSLLSWSNFFSFIEK